MKNFLTAFLFFLSLNCTAQTFSQSDFSVYTIPSSGSKSWYKLALSKDFCVSVVDGKLQITQSNYPHKTEYPIGTGTLLAIDLGEFGGGLYYKPTDTIKEAFFLNGKSVRVDNQINNLSFLMSKKDPLRNLVKKKHLHIASDNIKTVIPYKNGWLYMTGLAHMGFNYGALWRLTMDKDSFIVSRIFDLKASPAAITEYKHKIYIAAYGSVHSIDKDLKRDDVINAPDWAWLYPNSIAIINKKKLYVGMRGGYAQVNLKSKQVLFYAYNNNE